MVTRRRTLRRTLVALTAAAALAASLLLAWPANAFPSAFYPTQSTGNRGADVLAIVTDVDAVYSDWGTPDQRAIRRATPESLAASEFAAGSMGPKVRAACEFVTKTGKRAAIGSIADTQALVQGEAGTVVTLDAAGLELAGVS